eukprot:7730871-Pyramimonas_sp.AAC.1
MAFDLARRAAAAKVEAHLIRMLWLAIIFASFGASRGLPLGRSDLRNILWRESDAGTCQDLVA